MKDCYICLAAFRTQPRLNYVARQQKMTRQESDEDVGKRCGCGILEARFREMRFWSTRSICRDLDWDGDGRYLNFLGEVSAGAKE